MVIPFVIVFIVSLTILLLASFVTKRGASVVHILLLTILFLVWIESVFLNRGLPQLTGEADLFRSPGRLLLDMVIWLVILICALVYWKILSKNFKFLLFVTTFLYIFGMAEGLLLQNPQENVERISATTVLDESSFSKKDNVVFLLLDAMSTGLVMDYLDENPEMSEELEGFVLFKNNMETASSTQYSLPSILRGENYENGEISEDASLAFEDKNSLLQIFDKAGYDSYVSSTLAMYNYVGGDQKVEEQESSAVKVTPELYGQFSIRFVPYVAKNEIANKVGFATTVMLNGQQEDGNVLNAQKKNPINFDELTYFSLEYAANKKSSIKPTFHLHHVNGTHKPYTVGADGQPLTEEDNYTVQGLNGQNTWTWNHVMDFLKTLKDNDLYESSTIVILGDHGDRLFESSRTHAEYTGHAALLIKPPYNEGDLVVSKEPTSNGYLAEFIPKLHIEGENWKNLIQDLPEERSLLIGGTEVRTYKGTDVTKLEEVSKLEVTHDYSPTSLKVGTTYSLSTLNTDIPEIAYPLNCENGNLVNGWGLRMTDSHMTGEFLTEESPGTKLTANLGITYTKEREAADEQTYRITITDPVSKVSESKEIDVNKNYFELEQIQVSEDQTIRLEVEIDNFPSSGEATFYLTRIELSKGVKGAK